MSIFIDAAILIMLVASIAYSIHVSRKVTRLMECLRQIQPVFSEFAKAVDRSEASVSGLSTATEFLLSAQSQAKADPPEEDAYAQPESDRDGLPSTFPGRASSDIVRGFFEVARKKGTMA